MDPTEALEQNPEASHTFDAESMSKVVAALERIYDSGQVTGPDADALRPAADRLRLAVSDRVATRLLRRLADGGAFSIRHWIDGTYGLIPSFDCPDLSPVEVALLRDLGVQVRAGN